MAGSINKVIVLGNLGNDPEVKMSQDGSKILTFSLATSEGWVDKKTGERKERTEWHRVVVFNEKLAEIGEKYLFKGTKVYLEGQLQTRQWKDSNGVDKFTTEIVLSRFRGEMVLLDRASGPTASLGSSNSRDFNQDRDLPPSGDILLDDEIPF